MYNVSLYAGSSMGNIAAHFVSGSGSTSDVQPVCRERQHYRASADCGVRSTSNVTVYFVK